MVCLGIGNGSVVIWSSFDIYVFFACHERICTAKSRGLFCSACLRGESIYLLTFLSCMTSGIAARYNSPPLTSASLFCFVKIALALVLTQSCYFSHALLVHVAWNGDCSMYALFPYQIEMVVTCILESACPTTIYMVSCITSLSPFPTDSLTFEPQNGLHD